ncbi:MAG: hypothetical protein H3C62_15715, partial [Gemmatimonadaceae bacterium]|nr:hypothetical protein [Gemmatimonadaceae bacterium]
ASDKKIPEEAMKEWAAAFVRTVAEKLGEGELLDDVVTAALAAASEAAQRALMRHGGMAKNWEMPEVVEPPAEAGD